MVAFPLSFGARSAGGRVISKVRRRVEGSNKTNVRSLCVLQANLTAIVRGRQMRYVHLCLCSRDTMVISKLMITVTAGKTTYLSLSSGLMLCYRY